MIWSPAWRVPSAWCRASFPRSRPTWRATPVATTSSPSRRSNSPDVQWREHPVAREAYLERLWSFVQRLAPVHNGLKAHVLQHRLQHDLALGRLDKPRFMSWLRLPRSSNWCNPKYVQGYRNADVIAAPGKHSTALGPTGDEFQLLSAYLSSFFVQEGAYAPYEPFVKEHLLTRQFAETKILHGIGDMERWYSLLDSPSYYEQLRRRVEITFPATQRTSFGADEAVSLSVDCKNVETLLVKVFEVDAFGWYRDEGREVDATLPLDGLVAGEETTYSYDDNPLRRVRRSFDFPALTGPGVYVVEFIGGGLSSRAVIRKGRLQLRERRAAAGHALSVFDETGVPQPYATLTFGGREYTAGERGEILVPYSTDPGERTVILRSGERCTLERFDHAKESYSLRAGMLIDREAMLTGNRARLLVRPQLTLAGEVVDLGLLEDPVLHVLATRADGVTSNLELRDLELSADRELVQRVQVPPGTVELRAHLSGHLRSLSLGEPVQLTSNAHSFALNKIEHTAEIHAPLLGRDAAGWFLEVRGKNGEPRVGAAVSIQLWHRDYTDVVAAQLRTDDEGRVTLGALDGITGVPGARGRAAAGGLAARAHDAHVRHHPARGGGPAPAPALRGARVERDPGRGLPAGAARRGVRSGPLRARHHRGWPRRAARPAGGGLRPAPARVEPVLRRAHHGRPGGGRLGAGQGPLAGAGSGGWSRDRRAARRGGRAGRAPLWRGAGRARAPGRAPLPEPLRRRAWAGRGRPARPGRGLAGARGRGVPLRPRHQRRVPLRA